jgi:hypothetical protein
MRIRLLLALLLLIVLEPRTVRAADSPPSAVAEPEAAAELPRDMLVADLGQHVVGFGYQRSTSRWVAAQLTASYYQPWTQNIDFLGLSGDANRGGDLRGVIGRVRVFFHPFGAAPTGLWISPFAQAGVGWGLRNGERRAGPVSAVGASVGYSALLGSSVLLGGGFGLQYHAAKIPGGEGPPRFSRYYPQVDIQLGYLF